LGRKKRRFTGTSKVREKIWTGEDGSKIESRQRRNFSRLSTKKEREQKVKIKGKGPEIGETGPGRGVEN